MPKEDDKCTYLTPFWLGYASIKGLQFISMFINVTESHPVLYLFFKGKNVLSILYRHITVTPKGRYPEP